MHDFEAAKKKATLEKKDLFIEFTGSDWCPPCQDLSSRILSQETFTKEATEKYILVELDFPNDKSQIAPEISAQNQQLAETYGIRGFPTILLTDAQGRPFGQTGHHPGTPQDYLAHLADLQKNKTARDLEFAKAENAKGVDKAKALFAGLKKIPYEHIRHYQGVIGTILANDPQDQTNFVAEKEKKEAAARAQNELYEKMAGLEEQLDIAIKDNDFTKAIDLVEQFVKDEQLEGTQKQQALSIKISILMEEQNFEGIEQIADEIIAINPSSNFSQQLISFKNNQLQKMLETQPASPPVQKR